MSIGENIKRLRESRGLTQSQLGDAIGVTDKAVSTWESGTRMPRMNVVDRLAAFFGIDKRNLLFCDGDHFLSCREVKGGQGMEDEGMDEKIRSCEYHCPGFVDVRIEYTSDTEAEAREAFRAVKHALAQRNARRKYDGRPAMAYRVKLVR